MQERGNGVGGRRGVGKGEDRWFFSETFPSIYLC